MSVAASPQLPFSTATGASPSVLQCPIEDHPVPGSRKKSATEPSLRATALASPGSCRGFIQEPISKGVEGVVGLVCQAALRTIAGRSWASPLRPLAEVTHVM